MEAKLEATADRPLTGLSLTTEIWAYLATAFGFSWAMWVGVIKLGLAEEFLNIGTAGPAVAAMVLSRGIRWNDGLRSRTRWLSFVVLTVPCWMVISLHYLWRSGTGLEFRLNSLLLAPSLFPAWVLSGAFATDEGVRRLLRRLLHAPNRWSAFALLYFPFLLGIPTVVAHAVGVKLVKPEPHTSVLATVMTAMLFLFFNFLFVATLEEPGWRGFLLDRLQQKMSPLSASLLVWLPWATWHAPLDYYRPTPWSWIQYVLLRVVFLIPLTIILTWLYNRSGRSIQATAIFHATMNTYPFVAPYYQPAWFLIFVFAAYAVIGNRMWRVAQRVGNNYSAC